MSINFFQFTLAFFWVTVPFVWFFILRIGGMNSNVVSIPVFLLYFILLFQYIGYPILFFSLDDYRAEFVVNQSLLIESWVITSCTTALFCIGSLLASISFGRINYTSITYRGNNQLPSSVFLRLYLFFILGIVVLINYVLNIGLDNIALIRAIQGQEGSAIILARSAMGNDFGSSYHWYSFFMKDLLVFVFLAFLGAKLNGNQKISMITMTFLSIAIVFSLTMATEKGLLIDFIVAVALVYLVTKKNAQFSWINLCIIGFVTIVPLSVFYIAFMGDKDLTAALFSIVSRAFTGSIQPAYHYLEFIPAYQNWLYGESLPNPRGIFPFDHYNLTTEIMNFVHPELQSAGVVGTMPAIYWGEVYANFGYWGLLFFPCVLGYLLYLINVVVFRVKVSPLSVALFVWMLIHYKNLSITSISSYLLDSNLFLIIFVYISCTFFGYPRKRAFERGVE